MDRLSLPISHARLALVVLLLAGCQAAPTPRPDAQQVGAGQAVAAKSDSDAPPDVSGLAALPACAADLVGTLSSGLRIAYRGSDAKDADLCLLHWSGRSHALYFGFWNDYGRTPMSDAAREAFRSALTGPVGAETAFDEHHARLWKRATVSHFANGTVTVAGVPRAAVALRVVLHDAHGRPRVSAETRYWIDRATGVMLRRESVTPMAHGKRIVATTWRIGSLDPGG